MPEERGQLKQASRTTPDLRFLGHFAPHPESDPAVFWSSKALTMAIVLAQVEERDAWRGVR